MEKTQKLVVDLVLPAEAEVAVKGDQPKPPTQVGPCRECGAGDFVLASEMPANAIKGVPASRMYECRACGAFQLAK